MGLFDVTGRVIIITGAGSGIGRGIVLGLGAQAAVIFGLDRDAAGLAETTSLATGQSFQAIACDVAVEAEVVTAFAEVMAKTGRVDVVFANAGIAGHPTDIDSLDLAEWRRVQGVNIDGTFLTMRAAARIMTAQGACKIIAAASTWGVRGTRGGTLHGLCRLQRRAGQPDAAIGAGTGADGRHRQCHRTGRLCH